MELEEAAERAPLAARQRKAELQKQLETPWATGGHGGRWAMRTSLSLVASGGRCLAPKKEKILALKVFRLATKQCLTPKINILAMKIIFSFVTWKRCFFILNSIEHFFEDRNLWKINLTFFWHKLISICLSRYNMRIFLVQYEDFLSTIGRFPGTI